jgi:hypothetical protein
MAAKYSNVNGISLPMAVWLARDEYSHDARTNVISVTSLLKSPRQLVLGMRVPQGGAQQLEDVSNRLASRLGTSIHNSIESSWVDNHKQGLLDLGYPMGAVKRVLINPTAEELTEDSIPLYFEKRSEKQVGNWIISGQFDLVYDGMVMDFKSTSVFTFINKTNDTKYSQQGSLYKWLNPDLINQDDMAVQFIFKDWNKNMVKNDPRYPKLPVLEYKVPLMSVSQSEMYVKDKIASIELYMDAPDEEIPQCTDEDLWRRNASWKYYSKDDAKKASKVFDNVADANMWLANKNKGYVKEFKSEPIACRYCSAFSICSQAQGYIRSGELS